MVKLSDVCDVRDGTHDSPKYVEYGYPLVTSKNIKDGQLDLSIVNFITEEDYNKINERSKVDVGDIIMPMIGTIGNPYLVEEFCDFAIKNVALIKCDNIKVINKFVWYFLQSNAFERYVDTKNKGGTQKFLSLGDIRAIELPEVSIDKQKHIVEILIRVDGIVAKRKQQLQKLDELVKARFVEMFGDSLNTVRLGDCCEVHARIGWQALTKDEHMKTGDYMLVTGTDFKNGEIDYSTCVYVTKERYEMDRHIILQNDDVLITKDGTIGKVAIIHNLPRPATLNAGVFVVRPDERFNKEYIANVFRGPLFSSYVEESKTGATIKHLNQKRLVEFRIPVPSLEEQMTFAQFTKRMDESRLNIQNSLDKLEMLKKALMQEYFG